MKDVYTMDLRGTNPGDDTGWINVSDGNGKEVMKLSNDLPARMINDIFDFMCRWKEPKTTQRVFTITENGFLIDGSGKVAIPACKVKAESYQQAVEMVDLFLKTRSLTDDIELITPMDRIDFPAN